MVEDREPRDDEEDEAEIDPEDDAPVIDPEAEPEDGTAEEDDD